MLFALSATATAALALGLGHWIAPAFCGDGPALLAGPELLVLIAPWRLAITWSLMLVAMTPVLLVQPLRHLWHRSFADRRLLMLAVFGTAYLLIWSIAGVPLVILAFKIRAAGLTGWSILIPVAMVWQVSPARQVCLNRCHRRPPIAGFGVRAFGSAASYGLSYGGWCVASCWPWMLAPLALLEHQLAAMGAATLFMIAERMNPPAPPRWGWRTSGKAVRTIAILARRWSGLAANRLARLSAYRFQPNGRIDALVMVDGRQADRRPNLRPTGPGRGNDRIIGRRAT